MLPPHELKTKKFAKVFHGYSPEEVDDQISFLLEQYTELYRENDELERKLRLALAQVDAYKNDEESIRSALVGAQKAGGKIVRDANEQAELLLRAAKETCDRMVNETAIAVREQNEVLCQLRAQASAFQKTLLAQYAEQTALIEQTAQSEKDTDLSEFADEELVRSIIAGIKDEAERLSVQQADILPMGKKQRSRGADLRKKEEDSSSGALPVPTEGAEQAEAAPSESSGAESTPASPALPSEETEEAPASQPSDEQAPAPTAE